MNKYELLTVCAEKDRRITNANTNMRTVVTLSGGKASAWCADWALKNCDNVVLYFNDVKWEHPDLYRFLDDLEKHWNVKIHRDSDGRSPEELFFDEGFLGNSRIPVCSRVLKAKVLHKFYKEDDVLIFGIGVEEKHRVIRITNIYDQISNKRWKKDCSTIFPLIEQSVTKEDVDGWLKEIGIEQPLLYKLGFSHNNCSGGCVRAGKKQWSQLLEMLPDVYAERERMENEFRREFKKDVTILKDITLTDFRTKLQRNTVFPLFPEEIETECVGICTNMN